MSSTLTTPARDVPARPVRSPRTGPTRLSTADLLATTDQHAADLLDGRLDHRLPADGAWPTDHRFTTRLARTDELDVWLIGWLPELATALHDHAGSLGALTVVSGDLTEDRWTGADLRRRTLHAGDQAAFPLGWVHDVRSAAASQPGPRRVDQTLSVHAYSPPLTAMSYYEVSPAGALRRTRSVLTDHPEEDA